MATHPYLLEHEILKTLYSYVQFGIRGEGKLGVLTTPVFKRDYQYSSLHFGTLVGILNKPENYTVEAKPELKTMGWLKNYSASYEEVGSEDKMKYGWVEVSDALDVLVENKHVRETPVEINIYSDNMKRVVYLETAGALAFRNNFYLKESERELSLQRGYQIQQKDLWLKKNFWRIEMGKYIMGGIIGAAIALGAKQINKEPPPPTRNSSTLPATLGTSSTKMDSVYSVSTRTFITPILKDTNSAPNAGAKK